MPKPLWVVALVLLTACAGLHAQDGNANITVEVTDLSGAVVPGAKVKVLPLLQASRNDQHTNQYGRCSLTLPPGSYSLFVSGRGFLPWTEDLRVRNKKLQTVRVVLQVAVMSETVEVCTDCLMIEYAETGLELPPNLERARLLNELLKRFAVQVIPPIAR